MVECVIVMRCRYKQELRREFGLFASFSSSLALMAYSSGLTGAHMPTASLNAHPLLPWRT